MSWGHETKIIKYDCYNKIFSKVLKTYFHVNFTSNKNVQPKSINKL